MIIAIMVGRVIRSYKIGIAIKKRIGVIILFSVCLLLFTMGIKVATDPLITENFFKIGWVSLLIFVFVSIGTLTAVSLSTRWIDGNRKRKLGDER